MLKQNKSLSFDLIFLLFIYLTGCFFRILPRLGVDPYLLHFAADIWYRLCLIQYVVDFGSLPEWDIRYQAYGNIPVWYNPLAIYFFATIQKITTLDLPVIVSRIMPFIEAVAPLPFYILCKELYNIRVAIIATLILSLTPTFIFWSGISTPQGFTLFILPIILLLWIRFIDKRYCRNNRWIHLFLISTLLAINFLMHLTFFNTVIILLLTNFALIREKRTDSSSFVPLIGAILLSQIITAWWWLPKNLYWYWTQVLSTSSALVVGFAYLSRYGFISALLGHIGFFITFILVIKKRKSLPPYYFIPIYWAIFPFVESHMEGILHLFQNQKLLWNNLIRPIEGYRFYSFLAQPLAICFALSVNQILESKLLKKRQARFVNPTILVCLVLSGGLLLSMFKLDNFVKRFQYHMVNLEDINAAQWYRANSKISDRILADYYSAQMFSGVNAGRALLGSMFPLKNIDTPHISQGYSVLFDIYKLYETNEPAVVDGILRRYNCTHVYLSKTTLRYIEFVVNGFSDMEGLAEGKFDRLVNKDFSKTLLNPKHFETIYENKDIKILKWKKN